METTLVNFNQIYNFMYSNNQYSKLNEYFEVKLIQYDNKQLPFNALYGEYFGTPLSKESSFFMKLPRIYYCTIQAFIYSSSQFSLYF